MQDTEILIIVIAGTTLLLFMAGFVTLFILIYQRKYEQFSRTLLESRLEIQEETLEHISKELHDNLGHIASLVKIYLNTIVTDNEADREKIEVAKDVTKQLIRDIKQLSVRLSANPVIQNGLVAAVEKETERLNQTGLLTASMATAGDVPYIENDKAIILYRMVQEIINNIIKHSEGKKVIVNLEYINKSIILVVRDDGKGFDMEQGMNKGGAGLLNLKNRAQQLKATLNIESKPNHGTVITIQMRYP